MKPTREQIEQWQDRVDGGKDDRLFTHTQDWLTEFATLAYQAGAEKGKEDYEREHLRHAIPLPDALRAIQNQVSEACAKLVENRKPRFSEFSTPSKDIAQEIRDGEWRKYMGETK